MVRLIAREVLDGQGPATRGGATLAVLPAGRITSVAPFDGQEAAVSAALAPAGLSFPTPNRVETAGEAAIVWTGRGQAFLIGADPAPLAGLAALTDQSDGWAGFRLDGPAAPEVLARLVPLDLRYARFAEGSAARAPLQHMMSVIWRAGEGFRLLTFRSMARTAWHELTEAMEKLAARAG